LLYEATVFQGLTGGGKKIIDPGRVDWVKKEVGRRCQFLPKRVSIPNPPTPPKKIRTGGPGIERKPLNCKTITKRCSPRLPRGQKPHLDESGKTVLAEIGKKKEIKGEKRKNDHKTVQVSAQKKKKKKKKKKKRKLAPAPQLVGVSWFGSQSEKRQDLFLYTGGGKVFLRVCESPRHPTSLKTAWGEKGRARITAPQPTTQLRGSTPPVHQEVSKESTFNSRFREGKEGAKCRATVPLGKQTKQEGTKRRTRKGWVARNPEWSARWKKNNGEKAQKKTGEEKGA